VVVVSPDGTDADPTADADQALADRLAALPCVVVAIDRPPGRRPLLADLVPEAGVATVDDVLRTVERNPVAATASALLLRGGARSLGAGLVAESAVYSVLQAGPEFATWRAARPVAEGEPDQGPAVLVERNGDRLDIVLNRPAVRNALNTAMRDGLLSALALGASDPSLTSVVWRGAGPSFSSGGDLNEFGQFVNPASAHLVRLATSIGRAVSALGPRLRVEVHGPCAGSGVELPAFAAHVMAQPDFTATLPEVSLGLIPGAGGTWSITQRVGRHRMALLALSGARIGAATALDWGLVDEVGNG
jgi:hypothetical protein